MNYYLFKLFFFILTNILLIILLSNRASFLRLIDVPNIRKLHTGDVPLIGGIAIYLSVISFLYFLNSDYWINLIIYSSIIILIVGALDDAFQLDVTLRLVCQIFACVIIFGGGLKILSFGQYEYFPYVQLGLFGFFVSCLSVVALTNAMNFMDGVDGLSAGLSLIAILGIIAYSFIFNNYILAPIFETYFYIVVSILIFLFFNLGFIPKLKIFLGDSGSMTLGFIIGWLLIYNTRFEINNMPQVLALWCISIPIYDLFGVIIRRFVRGLNPFSPDRRHLHHILMDKGFNPTITVIIILLSSLVLLFLGGFIYFNFGSDLALLGFILSFIFYLIITLILSKSFKKF